MADESQVAMLRDYRLVEYSITHDTSTILSSNGPHAIARNFKLD